MGTSEYIYAFCCYMISSSVKHDTRFYLKNSDTMNAQAINLEAL